MNENNIGATLRSQTLTSFTAQSEGVRGMTGGAMEEALRDYLGVSTVGVTVWTMLMHSGLKMAKVGHEQQFRVGV